MSASDQVLAGQEPAAKARKRNIFARYFSRFDDGEVARWAFGGLLLGTIGVLAIDVREIYEQRRTLDPTSTGGTVYVEPALPPATRPGGRPTPSADPREHVTLGDDALRRPLRFDLLPGGVMSAEGSIDIGAASRFSDEIAARGEYVKTLSLNSPGGSLDDAMAMARLVRERGIATEVADGALCASSCPLIMAGGVTRHAGEKAAIGLHQFYAAAAAPIAPAQAMSDAQATAARISRYLAEMGVDPALWLHALDTPPQALYYLTPQELTEYRLVTGSPSVASQ